MQTEKIGVHMFFRKTKNSEDFYSYDAEFLDLKSANRFFDEVLIINRNRKKIDKNVDCIRQ